MKQTIESPMTKETKRKIASLMNQISGLYQEINKLILPYPETNKFYYQIKKLRCESLNTYARFIYPD
jgi:hypothetical protein